MSKRILFGVVVLLAFLPNLVEAQHAYNSVLSEHTWYKLSVAEEGIYKLDYTDLQRMGVGMENLNPNQIRLFGNPSGALSEKNSNSRPDDLSEIAVYVSGADDGSFDENDYVLFYGQESTRWNLVGRLYERDRNYYTDSTFYFLCVDSGTDGMRVCQQASLPVEGATTIISEFLDFQWHEQELMSPYSQCRNWFGEYIMAPDSELTLPFVFPHLVHDRLLTVKASVLGRCSGQAMSYDMWLNNNCLVNNASISAYGKYNYGNVKDIEKQCMVESDTAFFTLTLGSHPNGAMLYLDYVEVYAWRQLRRVGDFFPFRLIPSQFGEGKSAVWVQDAENRFWIWDVSNPMSPQHQEGILSAGNFVFALEVPRERRYVMFDPAMAKEVSSWKAIANQNLHAISTADMLIISSPLFLQQAQELADYHLVLDGLHGVVADVEEIYNEFSTGTPDPTAIRDFIRMVYLRNSENMRYVTLFGRPSFDYRNLKGAGGNFVPCYEQKFGAESTQSFATDDYFALMDDSEGADCGGRVDIGIGRLPVSTVEEAEAVLRKIKLYDNLVERHGEWKADILYLCDDEDSGYVVSNETYCSMLDTLEPALKATKIYCGAYPHVSTSTGVEIPQANADLMEALNKGVSVLCYTGHGGVRGLTGENVFTVSNINALENHEKMPFVFTATCEFTKYDDPLLVSAGEQFFLLPDGGTAAILTPCRPTFGTNNTRFGKALMNVLTQREANGSRQRLGDIVRRAKSSGNNFVNTSNRSINISFNFLGDPAMRLPLPQEEVALLKINGEVVGSHETVLHAMSMTTLEGVIRTPDGQIDADFNGELWVRLYDKKTAFDVAFLTNGVVSHNIYKHHREMIYNGRVSVEAGRFFASFQVPKDINLDYGMPRFEFYAYDSIRNNDAMGKFDHLSLGGVDPSAVIDDEGPQIQFYWNTPDFVNGSVVECQGVLYADLYDAQGLYHYDYSLGRNITMSSNWPACNNLVLNDRFEPALDDFRRGRIAIPVEGLMPGTYEFTLKAWDTQDNSSEARLWFMVVDNQVFLTQVWNYPNPFSEETRFHFIHNGEDGDFQVDLEIFDMMGRYVARLSQMVTLSDGVMTPFCWNGIDDAGKPLRSGLYFYRFTFTDENGRSRSVSQKMIVSR